METLRESLYDHPAYYDLIFGSDWKAEFDFLQECFRRYARRPVRRVFEPACGTGRLLCRLAKGGFEVSGLDLNRNALQYCNRRLTRWGYPPTAFYGDMSDFRLPRKADAAFNTINSFRHLTRARDATAHLRCMASSLRKGGLYILGLHLTPTQGRPTGSESWSARRGNLCVTTSLRTTERNLRNRLERFRMTCAVYTPTRSFRLVDEIRFRTYTAAQFRQLVKRAGGLEIVAAYDFAYQIDDPIQVGPKSEDVVFVLRKT